RRHRARPAARAGRLHRDAERQDKGAERAGQGEAAAPIRRRGASLRPGQGSGGGRNLHAALPSAASGAHAVTRRALRGGEVLRSADAASAERLDLWIEDGRIAAVTPPEAAPHFAGDVEQIDARGTL